jgi:hypothetical protein
LIGLKKSQDNQLDIAYNRGSSNDSQQQVSLVSPYSHPNIVEGSTHSTCTDGEEEAGKDERLDCVHERTEKSRWNSATTRRIVFTVENNE